MLLVFGCCFALCFGALATTGSILVVTGQDKLNDANAADPTEDVWHNNSNSTLPPLHLHTATPPYFRPRQFTDLGKVCTVTDVKHCWKTKTRNVYQKYRNGVYYDKYEEQEYCMDTYTYDFKVDTSLLKGDLLDELEAALSGPLTSKKDSKERKRDDKEEWDESCRQAGGDSNDDCHEGDWRTDDGTNGPAFDSFKPLRGLVRCWAPQNGLDESNLPSVYACGAGNEACIKINNPADEKGSKKDEADGEIIGGYVCLGVGSLCLVLAILMFCCASQQGAAGKRAQARHVPAAVPAPQPVPVPVAQPNMAVAQPITMPVAYAVQPTAMPTAYPAQSGYPAEPTAVPAAQAVPQV